MNIYIRALLNILSGLLLFAAWPVSPLTFLIFIAWVPLLWLENRIVNDGRFFLLLYLNLFIWNILTTWWIWNASPGGAVGAIVANSALMCCPWMFYRYSKKQLGENAGLFALLIFWLSFEYVHHSWELSWPWLTLGNAFSVYPGWVQWYEFTGTAGGSLWVLLVNILVFKSFAWQKRWPLQKGARLVLPPIRTKYFAAVVASLAVPMTLSLFLGIFRKTAPADTPNNVVVVQPNVEPYTEKFNTDPEILVDRMIKLTESLADSNTRLVLWPETAIPVPVWEHEIEINRYYQKVFELPKRYPHLVLLTGIDSYKNWGKENPGGFSIRKLNNDSYYEAFNTAFATDSSGKFLIYHKSKLVPGVESLPSWLDFMSAIFDDLGGTTGTLGRSKQPAVFKFESNPFQPAPIICYESIYADYVAEYCRNGANILAIVTNDGWWGNTPGYRQHMNMARLRAIENRKWVARSANTGISCFIDPYGNVLQAQPWEKAAAIKMDIPVTDNATFFTTYGDWISRISWPLALAAFFWAMLKGIRKKLIRP